MESQPQNPEFRNNPEKFHPCVCKKQRCRSVQCHFYFLPTQKKIALANSEFLVFFLVSVA